MSEEKEFSLAVLGMCWGIAWVLGALLGYAMTVADVLGVMVFSGMVIVFVSGVWIIAYGMTEGMP